MYERDYILRLVNKLAAALAAIAGASKKNDYEEAIKQIETAWSDLFGVPAGLLDVIDAMTLEQLLGPDKLQPACDLLMEEIRVLEAKGDLRANSRRKLLSTLQQH